MRTLARVAPEWLDAENLNIALYAGMGSLVLAALLTLRLIRRMALKLIVAMMFLGAAAVLGLQWGSLRDCQETCSCEVLGRTVSVPSNPLCGEDRVGTRSPDGIPADPLDLDIDYDLDRDGDSPDRLDPSDIDPSDIVNIILDPDDESDDGDDSGDPAG